MKTLLPILILCVSAAVFSARAQNVVVAGALTYGPVAVPTGPVPSVQGTALSAPTRVVYRAPASTLTIGSSFRPRPNLYSACFTPYGYACGPGYGYGYGYGYGGCGAAGYYGGGYGCRRGPCW
jgi:hypothetical protein